MASFYEIGVMTGPGSYATEWKKAALKSAKKVRNGLGLPALKVEIPTIVGSKCVVIGLPAYDIGFSFNDIKHGVNRLGRASKQALAKANTLLSSREAQSIMSLTAGFVPGAAQGYQMAKAASRMIDSAAKGSKAEKAKIAAVAVKAKEGNENAEAMIKLMAAMLAARQDEVGTRIKGTMNAAIEGDSSAKKQIRLLALQAKRGDNGAAKCLKQMIDCKKQMPLEVSGFFFNKGMRSSIVAATTSPAMISRAIYLKGLKTRVKYGH